MVLGFLFARFGATLDIIYIYINNKKPPILTSLSSSFICELPIHPTRGTRIRTATFTRVLRVGFSVSLVRFNPLLRYFVREIRMNERMNWIGDNEMEI